MGSILQKELESTKNYNLCFNTKRIINTQADKSTIIIEALKVITILEKWNFHYKMTSDYSFNILG